MLIPGKVQGRGGRGLLSASQVCGSGLCPPKRGVSGLSGGQGREIHRLEGLHWGFLCSLGSPSLRHRISAGAMVMARCPRVLWRRAGGAGLREVPPTPWFEAALLPALAVMLALGVSLLFLAPRLASDTKPGYFCRAASGPNTSRLSNAAKKKRTLICFFCTKPPCASPTKCPPTAQGLGVRQHPISSHAGKKKHLPAPWRLKTIRYPPRS